MAKKNESRHIRNYKMPVFQLKSSPLSNSSSSSSSSSTVTTPLSNRKFLQSSLQNVKQVLSSFEKDLTSKADALDERAYRLKEKENFLKEKTKALERFEASLNARQTTMEKQFNDKQNEQEREKHMLEEKKRLLGQKLETMQHLAKYLSQMNKQKEWMKVFSPSKKNTTKPPRAIQSSITSSIGSTLPPEPHFYTSFIDQDIKIEEPPKPPGPLKGYRQDHLSITSNMVPLEGYRHSRKHTRH